MAISGSIVTPGDVVNVTYSGGIQQINIQMDGLYKLEVWGASGGNTKARWNDDGEIDDVSHSGGLGGYSYGYIMLKKDTILYVVCGGVGESDTDFPSAAHFPRYRSGGYNGGGQGYSHNWPAFTTKGSGGGGATHIALIDGILSTLKNDIDKILIIAGGGGGSYSRIRGIGNSVIHGNGGGGGGLTGGNGVSFHGTNGGNGGTQSEGNAFGLGKSGKTTQEGSNGGGGGGLYGGNCIDEGSAGGGSGYIGGVPEIEIGGIKYSPTTSSGQNAGNGKASITLIAATKDGSSVYAGTQKTNVMAGTAETIKIYAGNAAVG